ncbi:MAG: hypothetical protein HWN70_13785 [Desulfobacterales bacterium]|nr:hypothetical protein [Desulfobacterales bacterium]
MTSYEPRSHKKRWEKKTETVATKLPEDLKEEAIRLGDITEVAASAFVRKAIQFYIDFLHKDIKINKDNKGAIS